MDELAQRRNFKIASNIVNSVRDMEKILSRMTTEELLNTINTTSDLALLAKAEDEYVNRMFRDEDLYEHDEV
jgi:hypothetical protein